MKFTPILLALGGLASPQAFSADQYFDGTGTNALTDSKWGPTAGGAKSSAFTTGNTAVFATAGGTGTGAGGISVGGIRAEENFTLSSPTGTLATGGTVATINVFTGKTLDLGSLATSVAAGTGLVKSGSGTYAASGGAFTGGFTLSDGTVIMRGVNTMGAGALALNGGTVASNANRDLTGKYSGGITLGGNVQFGEMAANVALANDTANLTFTNDMALGGVNRILTLGNGGNVGFGGVISNTGSNGVTFAATAGGTGRFDVTNTTNTSTGPVTITGGEVRFAANGSLGNANNSIIIDGGRFASVSNSIYTIASSHAIQVGSTAGTSISAAGSTGILTYDGVIADKAAATGILVKQGAGILSLGGNSTYTGNTSINNGTLQLTTANNRLPTGTVVSIGQAASANVGTLDLNGRNQEIAGLASTAGTNASASVRNLVTSTGAATLTINNGSDYVFSGNTTQNSGSITGAISLVKKGSGIQTLGEANTYTGTTTITAGTLALSGSGTLGNAASAVSVSGGILDLGGLLRTRTGDITLSGGAINNGTLTKNGGNFDAQAGSATAILDGTAGLSKTTGGTVTLSGTNTYTGMTGITDGTLQLNGSTAAASTVAVGTNGTLSGSGTVNGNATLTGSGIINKSSGIIAGTLGVSGGNWNGAGSVTGLVTSSSGTFNIADGADLTASSGVLASGGNMVINGTLTGGLTANSSTTVSGTGTINGNANIKGNHNPGTSPGIQNFGANLAYTDGASKVYWELGSDTTSLGSNPSANYDQIIVGGDLSFTDLTTLFLSFTGGSVQWGENFWSTDQSWVLYDVSGSTSGFDADKLQLSITDWQDSNFDALNTIRSGASFSLSQSGSDIMINYSVVPEPSSALLAAIGALALLRRRR